MSRLFSDSGALQTLGFVEQGEPDEQDQKAVMFSVPMIKSLLNAAGLQELGNKMSTHLLGKNLSTTDFCVVGLCRPPAGEMVGPELSADPTIILLLTLTQCHCFSPYLSDWVKSRWWGLREDKAKVSLHFKVTSLSQFCCGG